MAKEQPYENINSLQNAIAFSGQNVYMKGCFAPARWHRSQARSDIGFDTVYLVRCLNIFFPYRTPV